MVVQTNILSLNSHRNMKKVGVMQAKASERLSSGYRVNTAADDAAGLAISEKMRAQIRGLDMASRNVNDNIALVKTAEGGMQGIDDMVHRIRELVVMVSNDTQENNRLGTGDRQKVQDEINQLIMEIDDMSERVEFNRKKLINGSFADTAAQLAVSKATVDRTNLEVIGAQARYDALSSMLNSPIANAALTAGAIASSTFVAGTGAPSTRFTLGATNAALVGPAAVANAWSDSGAIALLDFFQRELDGAYTDRFQNATEIFTRAETVYQEQLQEYNHAKVELMTAFSDSRLAGFNSLDLRMFDPQETTYYLGPERVAQLSAATQRYNSAAKAIGIDEMGLQRLGAANTPTAGAAGAQIASALGLGARTAAGAGAGTAGTMSLSVVRSVASATTAGAAGANMATANLRWSDSPAIAGRGVATFQTAQRAFTDEQLFFNQAVATRDTAQSRLNSLQQQMTDQIRNLNAANRRNDAADISYRAAQDLDRAGKSKALHFQVGANANQSLILSIGSLKSNTLGIGDGNGHSWINVVKDSGQDITSTIDVLDQAQSYISTERSKLGAAQNRMEHTQNSLDITSENLSDAQSRIRDADMAKEMMNSTKANILQQVAVSMMAQANQAPQSVLQLLR